MSLPADRIDEFAEHLLEILGTIDQGRQETGGVKGYYQEWGRAQIMMGGSLAKDFIGGHHGDYA